MIKYQFESALDSPERTLEHRRIIRSKPFLNALYQEWYQVFAKEVAHLPEGLLVELGSGGGFLKSVLPQVISSDVLPLPGNDLTFSALKMPFDNEAVSGLFMIDTFHHLPDVRKFLQEANRTVRKGGKVIMTEPANSWLGRFIYKRLHHEPFNTAGDWTFPDTGPLSGANTALPWIVFIRDRGLFQAEFPDLGIEEIRFHTPLRYLLSGGVSYPQLVPGFTYPFFRGFDHFLASLSSEISLFMTIKLVKTGN